MRRLDFLVQDQLNNDHSLEVDVMRFVAILGIVFWIIFAMVKSIPLSNSEKKSAADPVIPKPSETVVAKKTAKTVDNNSSQEAALQKIPKGLSLQFKNINDLETMIQSGKARLFCHSSNNGFDLIFEGYVEILGMKFKARSGMPERLWELKNDKDRHYFTDRLMQTYPKINSMGTVRVLVSFVDADFDAKVEKTFSVLKRAQKQGVIYISSDNGIAFREFENVYESHDKFREGENEID